MKIKKITFELEIYNSLDELPLKEQELMQCAIAASKDAYAPYSKFRVGASVLLANKEIVNGNNQENACYPAGLCAERVAMFYAGAKYPNVTAKMIAITVSSDEIKISKPAAPCGNCRQALSEYEIKQKEPIVLLLMGDGGQVYKCNSIAAILPLGFDNSFLP